MLISNIYNQIGISNIQVFDRRITVLKGKLGLQSKNVVGLSMDLKAR